MARKDTTLAPRRSTRDPFALIREELDLCLQRAGASLASLRTMVRSGGRLEPGD